MKKKLAIVLSLAMVMTMALTACGGGNGGNGGASSNKGGSSSAQQPPAGGSSTSQTLSRPGSPSGYSQRSISAFLHMPATLYLA